ncbi:MAG TPA: MFS transporter, partial [Microthrixaceae bacterium]|nr:MFS transporter [Microthrixaceae bacterium]
MGVFFVVPLYLQLVIGLDALDTGLRMLPISITMFLFSAIGSRLSARVSVRTIVRTGLVVSTLAIVVLIATVDAQLNDLGFAVSMALLGVGMGLIVSQLGNVVQSSVDASGRGEAGGLQYTGQQLGSSVGVALIGAIVLAGLTNVFVRTIDADERIAPEVAQQVSTAAGNGVDFVASDDLAAAATDAGIDEQSADALVDDYEQAQLRALKTGLLVTGVLALLSLMSTRHLPATVTAGDDDREDDPVGDDPVGADPL